MSFRREKYVPKGGPDGGDGARGGDVVLVASHQLHDLSHFRHRHHFRAPNGGHGRGAGRRGAEGEPLRIDVPVGTEVRERDGDILGDLILEGQEVTVVHGGEGGRGNLCFKAPRGSRRASRNAACPATSSSSSCRSSCSPISASWACPTPARARCWPR